MMKREIGQYLMSDPEVCHGQLTFKGTRILVRPVLAYIVSGKSIDWVLAEWPRLERAAVQEALRLATDALIEQYEMRPAARHRSFWMNISGRQSGH
jgi:uncharacterized protein (DUF433 family)